MLVAQDFKLGHRLHDKPLICAVIFKSALFAIALICFHFVEHVLIGMWDGKPMALSIAEVGANRLTGIVSLGIIGTVALAPFFLLSELSRIIGRDNLWALFFHRQKHRTVSIEMSVVGRCCRKRILTPDRRRAFQKWAHMEKVDSRTPRLGVYYCPFLAI